MIDIQHSNERNFCGAITPKEKDKIMKAILDMAAHERKTFCFTPNDVPNLKINGKQFEMVIMDFFEKEFRSLSAYRPLHLCSTAPAFSLCPWLRLSPSFLKRPIHKVSC